MKYGYARVSSKEQNLARQIEALNDCKVVKIYQEKASGVQNDRPMLRRALKRLHKNDELIVLSLDRLSRDPDFLTQTMIKITLRGAKLRALDVPVFTELIDRNIQNFLYSVMVEIKKFMAAEERSQLLERQRQGIELAKQRGVYKGRVRLYGAHVKNAKRRHVYQQVTELLHQNIPITRIMRTVGCSNTLIYRIKQELKC